MARYMWHYGPSTGRTPSSSGNELVHSVGSVEADGHLGGGVAGPITLALDMQECIGIQPVKDEADVEKVGAENDAL